MRQMFPHISRGSDNAVDLGNFRKIRYEVEGGDTITLEFTYNHAGLRTRKVKKVNGLVRETTEYILNGKNVVELIHIKHDTSEINRLHFHYDAQNRVALVDFNGALYSYAHNLQGDIVGILDTNGDLIVEYKYDAWGKQISVTGSLITTLGELNPFRYRGYVWDTETKLYYLINRYYSCDLCRFATPDRDIIQQYSKSFCNIYAMCLNNPIKFADYTGLDNILVIYDCRYSGFFGLFNTGVGFDKQGKDLISRLEKEGHTVDEATFTSINEFVEKWNNDNREQFEKNQTNFQKQQKNIKFTLSQKRGRKSKNINSNRIHSKYSPDNIIKSIKTKLNDSLLSFLNKLINTIYDVEQIKNEAS